MKMKLCTVFAVLLVSLFATSMALPAQRRKVAHLRAASPQRLVVMQRLVHAPARRVHRHRSAALTADDCVHPGDVGAIEQQTAAESVLNSESDVEPYAPAGGQVSAEFEGSYGDGGADTAVAGAEEVPADEVPALAEAPEASPELPEGAQSGELPEAPISDNTVLDEELPEAPAADLPSDDAAKEPKELDLDAPADALPEAAPVDASAEAPADVPAAEAAPELPAVPEIPEIPAVPSIAESAEGAAAPAEEPVVPVAAPAPKPAAAAPPKRYLPPKRKVSVKLESDDDAAANAVRPARIPNARRPAKGSTAVANKGKGSAKAPLPVGTFFPISFGGTAGGAIAIANSFSTGEGGSATSHAIAYGTPEAARAKGRPSRRRH